MNKKQIANDGFIKFNEGYEKKGGINTDTKTPRPEAPKPQSQNSKSKKYS